MTKKIVTIGGGTGHPTILRGLKSYDVQLTGIVNVFDNGGSSGRLRNEFVDFGILAPGDLRNCLLALTDESKLEHMVRIFNHRLDAKSESLRNHNMGNLIIAVAQQEYGRQEGIKIILEMLGIKEHSVIPVSPDSTTLYARTSSGKTLSGQIEVSYPQMKEKITSLWLSPPANICRDAAEALKNSDLVVICPGDLYGSIIPNFLVQGLNESISKTLPLVYVCNLVTKQGQHRFRASNFVKEIEKYAKRKIDYIICNEKKPTQRIVDKYRAEDCDFVIPDISGKRVIMADLLMEKQIDTKFIARHNAEKTASLIMNLL